MCFNCPLRQSCYVDTSKAPSQVYRSWKLGRYPQWEGEPIERIRFGAFGEPILLGGMIVSQLTSKARLWLGYTHQWRRPEFAWAKNYFMASVETVDGAFQAESAGWRYFRVRPVGAPLLPDEIQCPASAGRIQCKDCGLCCGQADIGPHVSIEVHGNRQASFK